MTIRKERSYPFVVAGVVSAAFLAIRIWTVDCPLPADTKTASLLQSTLTLSSIAIGFLGTALSIIMSMGRQRVLRMMKDPAFQGKYYDLLIDYLMHAVYLCIAVAVFSVVGLVMGLKAGVWWAWLLAAILVYCAVAAALACERVVRLLAKILREAD